MASLSVFKRVRFLENVNLLNQKNVLTAEFALEKDSLRVLHQKNGEIKMFPASTTKILTCITAIENGNLDDIVKINKSSVGVEGSSVYLKEGEILTLKELLYCLMLRSGNDAATAIADYVGKGSVENFVKLMNDTAKKIGVKNSNFINPHGLHDDNHYVTAKDLALITAYAMKNDTFCEIVKTKRITVGSENKRVLINKNKLLYMTDNATGVKTGYTKNSGRCLVSSFNSKIGDIICVVLNCGDTYGKSKEIYSEINNDYIRHNTLKEGEIVTFYKTTSGEKVGLYVKNDVNIPVKKSEIDLIEVRYNIDKEKIKTASKDSFVGFAEIYIENNLIFSEKMYTISNVG